jgi:restriction system protein
MKLKMAKNSLFAVLLRSPWWISFALVGAIAVAAASLLPAAYVPVGVMGGLPFLVIGVMAAWRQWQAPNPARLAETLERVGKMSWPEFSNAVEQAFAAQGYAVSHPKSGPADLVLEKGGKITLVSGKRWKAASVGVEPLRELAAAKEAQAAHLGTYIGLGQLTDNARRFAQEQGLYVMTGDALAVLLSGKARP